MPYTLVHPVATIPIWYVTGRRPRLAALAIGALTPDYQYFQTLNTQGGFMHTPLGLLVACLPAGWITLLLWDRFGWTGLKLLLPEAWRNDVPSPPPYHVIGVSLAILAGAVSHVVWDSFTHAYGFVVLSFPAMSERIQIGPRNYTGYKWLQHGSTLLGGGILLLLALRWISRRPPVPVREVLGRWILAGLFLAGLAALNSSRFLGHSKERLAVTAAVAISLGVVFGPIVLGIGREAGVKLANSQRSP